MLRSADKRLALNEQISYEVFNQDWPEHLGSGRERIIHTGSPEFGLANFGTWGGPTANVTWPGANDPIAVPFRVFRGMVVYQLGWENGSGTMTDSVDIGIYDASWNRLVSGGGTARSGVSAIQWVDVTDTFLKIGKYYIVQSNNGVTANNARAVGSSLGISALQALGCFDSTTASYPLPNPLTNMVTAATFTVIPQSRIAARIPF